LVLSQELDFYDMEYEDKVFGNLCFTGKIESIRTGERQSTKYMKSVDKHLI